MGIHGHDTVIADVLRPEEPCGAQLEGRGGELVWDYLERPTCWEMPSRTERREAWAVFPRRAGPRGNVAPRTCCTRRNTNALDLRPTCVPPAGLPVRLGLIDESV